MKTKTWAVLLALALGLSLFTQIKSVRAEQPRRTKYEVVILQAQQMGERITNEQGMSFYQYGGIQVYCSSSSANAPKFQQSSIPLQAPLTDLAEAIAILLDDGYEQIGESLEFRKRTIY